MKKLLTKSIVTIYSVVLVAGCTSVQVPTSSIQPSISINHGASGVDGQLALGRYYMGQNLRLPAVIAFSKVLEREPEHVEALSSRAVMMAALGDLSSAALDLEAAIRIKSDAAHLHNNLGFVYFQQKRFSEAHAAYRTALILEPDNARALANLAQLPQLPQSGQLAAVGVLNDIAPPAKASSLATGTLASPKQVMQGTSNAEIIAGAVVNLRSLPIGPSTRLFDRLAAVTPVSSITVERGTTNNSVTTPSRTKLGIVNANGVQGLARLVRERLADTEQLSVKLENRTSYKQQVTFIQFRDTHMAQAIVLSRRIPGRPGVFLNNNMDRRFDVQLVLGLDVAKSQGSIGLLPPLSRARVAPALVSMTAPNEF